MANKLSIDIELNSKQYTDGARQAAKATEDVKKATEDYLKDFGPLRKQLAATKKEAQNLAAQFAMLGDAEKNSEFGKELAENLQIAIEKAAELQDVMADTNNAIKNAASDTAGLDALKEVFDIGKESATAYVGVLGRLTGSEKDLQKVVSTLAAVQGSFNAVIKTTNALQKNSATMIALQRSGVLSLAQAEKISAAATKASTVAVKGLGIAMKALPYVAVAAGVLAVGKAFVNLMTGANKAVKPVEDINKKLTGTEKILADVANTYTSNYASALGKTMGLYRQLQMSYQQMSSTHEKTKWIKENSDKLKELGISTKDVNEVDRILIRQSEQVIESFKLRAQAAAEAARLQDLYVKRIEAETEARKKANKKQIKSGEKVQAGDVDRFGLQEGIDYQQYKHTVGMFYTDAGAMKAQQALAANNIRTYTKEIDAEIEASADRLANATTKYNDILKGLGITDTTGTQTKQITDKQLTHLQELEDKAKDVQKQLENLDNTSPNFEVDKTKLQADLKAALQEVKDYRIAIGLDLPKTKLQELKDALKQAEADLPFAITDEDIQAAWAKINDLKEKISDEEVRLKIKVEPEQNTEDVEKVKNILNEDLVVKPKYDFSAIPDDTKLGKQAGNALEEYDALIDKRKQLIDIMNKSTSDQAIHDAQKGIEELNEKITESESKLDEYQKAANKIQEYNNIAKGAQKAGDYINQLGSAFTQLGDATDNDGLKALGIIATTIANMALSFSQAMVQAASMGPWAWLAFGITGLAQLTAMIVQIKSLTAGDYALGGVVPGHSYTGDKLIAHVNSGERILTAKQNENLERIANMNMVSTQQPNSIQVQGVIRGKDILLVQKNYNTIAKRSGQNIHIN